MSGQIGSPPLHGRRIFVVEENDALYLRIYNALRSAGGVVIGSMAHFPDLGPMVPPIRIDAALIDVDGWNSSLSGLAQDLKVRGIPTLLIGTGQTLGAALSALDGQCRIRKPLLPQDLIDGLASMLSSIAVPPMTHRGGDRKLLERRNDAGIKVV